MGGTNIGVCIEMESDAPTTEAQKKIVRIARGQMQVETTFRVDEKPQTLYIRARASTLTSPVKIHFYGVLPSAPSGIEGCLRWKKVVCIPRVLYYNIYDQNGVLLHKVGGDVTYVYAPSARSITAENMNGEGALTYIHKVSE